MTNSKEKIKKKKKEDTHNRDFVSYEQQIKFQISCYNVKHIIVAVRLHPTFLKHRKHKNKPNNRNTPIASRQCSVRRWRARNMELTVREESDHPLNRLIVLPPFIVHHSSYYENCLSSQTLIKQTIKDRLFLEQVNCVGKCLKFLNWNVYFILQKKYYIKYFLNSYVIVNGFFIK